MYIISLQTIKKINKSINKIKILFIIEILIFFTLSEKIN